jgi:hypothetical protein
MTFKIEKGIPIPEKQANGMKRYPFDGLGIGDSFFVPLPDGKSPSGLFSAISQAKKRLKISLFSAKVKGGRRVWRTSK